MPCKYPMFLKSAKGLIPCQKCGPCLARRRRQKTSRAIFEGQSHGRLPHFITLTYDDDHLPYEVVNPDTGEITIEHGPNPSPILDKKEYQRFINRLRTALSRQERPSNLRYTGCGEYGEKNGRPHYHFVCWGLPDDPREIIYRSWSDDDGDLKCSPARIDIQRARDLTHVAQYVVGYIQKKMTDWNGVRTDGRPPEFGTTSKSFGLQFAKLYADAMRTPSAQAFISREGDIPREIKFEGKKWPLDRYLRDKILSELNIYEQAKEIGQKKYEEEMQRLLACSPLSARFDSSLPTLLKRQYEKENKQSIANFESRYRLKTKPKEL